MGLITERRVAEERIDLARRKSVSMAIFCTASHWNTEAILLAGKKLCEKYGIERVPLSIAMTFNYPHMAQAQRVTHCRDSRVGFLSVMKHMELLCAQDDSPYGMVDVLPHLDHADPVSDRWALTDGLPWLSSVMFDAQRFPFEENVTMTRAYVESHGGDVMVEGIMEGLVVADHHGSHADASDHYLEKAAGYVKATGIDFLVADLGTEQQAATSGGVTYLKARAQGLTGALGSRMLVLHGTSSLDRDQMSGLAEDGVVRVNMWTKIAREAGRHAATSLFQRAPALFGNDFESVESNRYLMDSIDKASDMMLEILETLGYARFADR
jgi:fructose/tagatose bisphosphate aldolase